MEEKCNQDDEGDKWNKNNKMIQINTHEDVTYWCNQFSCSKKDLLDAIVKVGNSFNSIDAYLEMNCKKIAK